MGKNNQFQPTAGPSLTFAASSSSAQDTLFVKATGTETMNSLESSRLMSYQSSIHKSMPATSSGAAVTNLGSAASGVAVSGFELGVAPSSLGISKVFSPRLFVFFFVE
jgi:hypothetical protein